MSKHTISVSEIKKMVIEQGIAASVGRGGSKHLTFCYDIGRKRMYYIVDFYADGKREFQFDVLEEAVAAYNEA